MLTVQTVCQGELNYTRKRKKNKKFVVKLNFKVSCMIKGPAGERRDVRTKEQEKRVNNPVEK